jgi:hypothetical protein
MRRLLLEAVKTVETGGDPPGVGPSYYGLRPIEQIIPAERPWREALLPLMDRAAEREAVAAR